ncbi:ATP-grasp domain-containing protein [Gulbenkiania mobilis]|uniref:RimK-like ATP-grasp domain-containing protein n=1 Tax=Gulbenkiania mobilis TaxID=397457 RepID=A0ABY2CYZ1_GULMO|nr:RimK-like ATP-grasp domain-containing protein [Gulbenkiania mobilis]
MTYDVTVLTDRRWVREDENDWYSRQLHTEDRLVLEALQRAGLRAARRAWDDPDFDWNTTHAALFRTTWDYFDRFAEFSPWLDKVGRSIRLFNEAALIRWNIDKHYLGALAESGINTVPTYFVERGDPRSLLNVTAALGWEDLILKPAVSGAARHTYRFAHTETETLECTFGDLVEAEAMMLQPFQAQVLEAGELSLMVIDGKVTHAIRKTPKKGDFRVQDDHGGSVHQHTPSAEEARFAEAAVAAVPFDVLYARVDLVRDNAGQLAIMELEMIEPELFFRFCPEAADRLAHGLAHRLARH